MRGIYGRRRTEQRPGGLTRTESVFVVIETSTCFGLVPSGSCALGSMRKNMGHQLAGGNSSLVSRVGVPGHARPHKNAFVRTLQVQVRDGVGRGISNRGSESISNRGRETSQKRHVEAAVRAHSPWRDLSSCCTPLSL